MNEASLSPNHVFIRAILICTICALFGSVSVQPVKADAAPPPDPTVGGVGPYQPQKTNVQMMSETVFIDVPQSPSNIQEPKQIKVKASFTMRNQGQMEERMQVIFPLTRLGYGEQSLYEVEISSFGVKVDGQHVTTSEITTPPEVGDYAEVRWVAFEVTFPVQQDITLQVEYEMLNEYGKYGEGFTGIAYILETGAGWFGNILSAEISLRLPYPVVEEAIKSANPGYLIAGNEMRWNLTDFEPIREDNLEVKVIHADYWTSILDLRSKVKQNPNDAVAWASLGDKYFDLINRREGYIFEVDRHFTELGIEARQQAVKLSPESSDAHYKLAEILWLSNPSVINKFRMGGESTAPEPSLDDPAIQEILQEMQSARFLGSTNDLPYFNKVFPNVIVSTNGIITVTPTQTLAAFATSTTLPTVTPTVIALPSSTPVTFPIETSSSVNLGNLVLIALGLIIVGGIYFYSRKTKLRF